MPMWNIEGIKAAAVRVFKNKMGERQSEAGRKLGPSKRPKWLSLAVAIPVLCAASFLLGGATGWVGRSALLPPIDYAVTIPAPSSTTSGEAAGTGGMPDVRGMAEADARQAITDSGIDAGLISVDRAPSVEPDGTVVAQDPVAGTNSPAKIRLTLPSPATVPQLEGTTIDAANTELISLGVEVNVSREFRTGAVVGTVLNTDPAAGAPLVSKIRVTVAAAPAAKNLTDVARQGDWRNGLGSINGQAMDSGIYADLQASKLPATIIVNRTVNTLDAIVGIEDHSDPSAKVHVTVKGDGKILFEKSLAYGESEHLSLDVSNVLRLELNAAADGDPRTWKGSQKVMFGKAVLVGSQQAIDGLPKQ